MNEEWRIFGNLLCVVASVMGLISGIIAYDTAARWQRLSQCALSKAASIAFVVSTFASCTHAWASFAWRNVGVALFPQWDGTPMTYIASGLSVILPCVAFISIHVIASRLMQDKIAAFIKQGARHGYTR